MGKNKKKRNNFSELDEEFMQPWEKDRLKNKKEEKKEEEPSILSEAELNKLKSKNRREINKLKNTEKRNRKNNN